MFARRSYPSNKVIAAKSVTEMGFHGRKEYKQICLSDCKPMFVSSSFEYRGNLKTSILVGCGNVAAPSPRKYVNITQIKCLKSLVTNRLIEQKAVKSFLKSLQSMCEFSDQNGRIGNIDLGKQTEFDVHIFDAAAISSQLRSIILIPCCDWPIRRHVPV